MSLKGPDDECAECKHTRTLHEPKCTMRFCGCQGFSERHDPSPPDGRDWDDSDDEGNPGGI